MEMNVRSVRESLLSMEQVQKQAESLKSLEVYLSIDIKYVGVITKGSIQKCYVMGEFSESVGP